MTIIQLITNWTAYLAKLVLMFCLLMPQLGHASSRDVCKSIFFQDSRAQQRVYPGVLAQLQDGAQVFAFTTIGFGPGHPEVLAQLRSAHSGSNPVVKTLWMGELELQSDDRGHDYLVRANEISGSYYKVSQNIESADIPYENHIGSLRAYLMRTHLWNIHDTQFLTFQQSPAHLDEAAEQLKQKLNLQNTNHDIANILSGADGVLRLMRMKSFAPTAKTNEMFQRTLEKYVDLLDIVGGGFKVDTTRILQILRHFLIYQKFSHSDFDELCRLHDQLILEWRTNQSNLSSIVLI